jgi:flagellar biosynthesis protein FliP
VTRLAILFALLPGAALAQGISLDLGGGGAGTTARLVQLAALVGLLSLAPSLLVMVTAFARIVIVLALLRSAIGAPSIPPNPVLIGLALFLTLFVMEPVLLAAWEAGIRPMSEGTHRRDRGAAGRGRALPTLHGGAGAGGRPGPVPGPRRAAGDRAGGGALAGSDALPS